MTTETVERETAIECRLGCDHEPFSTEHGRDVHEQQHCPQRAKDGKLVLGFDPEVAYTVRTLDAGFEGERAGVPFVRGEARFAALSPDADEEFVADRCRRLNELAQFGYTVSISGEEEPRPVPSPELATPFDPGDDGTR